MRPCHGRGERAAAATTTTTTETKTSTTNYMHSAPHTTQERRYTPQHLKWCNKPQREHSQVNVSSIRPFIHLSSQSSKLLKSHRQCRMRTRRQHNRNIHAEQEEHSVDANGQCCARWCVHLALLPAWCALRPHDQRHDRTRERI